MSNTITIGCAFRPDGNGIAQQVSEKVCLEMLSRLPSIDAVNVVILPRGAQGPQTPERILNSTDLTGIDALFIPGSRLSNSTQVKSDRASQEDLPDSFRKPQFCPSFEHSQRERLTHEAQSRETFEIELLHLARNRGVPVLAVCAGLWRMVQAFGGQIELLPKAERAVHEAGHWNNYHGLAIKPNTQLASLSDHLENKSPQEYHSKALTVNSSHWAAPSKDAQNRLVQRQQPAGLENPNDTLEISAWTAQEGIHQSVEAVESTHGAPWWGTQFHAEPVMLLLGGLTQENAHPLIKNLVAAMAQAEPDFLKFSIELMSAFAQAALTKSRQRQLVASINANDLNQE